MIKDVKTVEILIGTLQEWNTNPLNTEIPNLCSLESGLLVSEELVKDFDSAKEEGDKQATKFFEERVLTNEKQIYDRINLNKRSNFSKPTVNKNTGNVRKTNAMENRAVVKSISLAETAAVDLEELIRYRLTEICLPLFLISMVR